MEIATIEKKVQPITFTFNEVLRLRKSCRGFLETPVPDETITSVLEDAALAPSNCNTQPWETHIVSGDKLKELSEALLRENKAQRFSSVNRRSTTPNRKGTSSLPLLQCYPK